MVKIKSPPDHSLATLCDADFQAISDLLPLLCCGEEAAATAFVRLANTPSFDDETNAALRVIGAEEEIHLALLIELATKLPAPNCDPSTLRASRVFHLKLARGGATLHLARIAAIDAAVCTILSRLLARPGPIGRNTQLSRLFMRIRSDESRHVAIARSTIRAEADRSALRDAAANAREGLAALLEPTGSVFEALGVDPDALIRVVRGLPNGLL